VIVYENFISYTKLNMDTIISDVAGEKNQNKMIMIAAGAFVLLVAVWWFFFRNKKTMTTSSAAAAAPVEKPTIYGSLGCPYTIKQMEKYKEHEFVDCSSGGCPSFVTAYPTTKWPNGKIEIGFS
jgi:hypothetical protein